MNLQDKVILVTGSTMGIGKATAKACAAAGAQVMIHGKKNERHAQEVCEELGLSKNYVIGDLTTCRYADLIEATVATFGRLDGLVNNAGIYPRNSIETATAGLFDTVMTVNVKAPMLLSQAAVAAFRRQKTVGSIVNIGSLNAYCGQTDLLIYSMSKGAMMTLTRNLADALGPEGIRVNQLNLGWTPTETEIAIKRKEGLPDNWQTMIPQAYAPLGRLLSPEEVARQVIFWLSDYSSPVTGAIYEVEMYPIIGRNRINDIQWDVSDQ